MFYSDRKAKVIITGQSRSEMNVSRSQTHCFNKKKTQRIHFLDDILLLQERAVLNFLFFWTGGRQRAKSSSINTNIFDKATSRDSSNSISNAAAPGVYRVHTPFNFQTKHKAIRTGICNELSFQQCTSLFKNIFQ